ncbi:MAG: hypothetical protein ACTHK7_04780 [Aureliella sp.]
MTATATRPIHPALQAALELDRESLNQRFRMSALQGAPLDPEAFFDHIATRLDKIVAAVHACFPERTRLVTSELYDVSLDLFRTGFFGPETRLAALEPLWTEVLPSLAPLVARAPQQVAGALSNALVNMATHSTARTDQWLSELSRIGPLCQSSIELLDVAGILAWRAGMAQLRSSALERLARLPAALAAQAAGLTSGADEAEWQRVRDRLAEDRWFHPASPVSASPPTGSPSGSLAIAHVVGGFRGFGGGFMKPPRVVLHEGWLYVHDTESLWRLYADCFGTHLQRTGEPAEIGIGRTKTATRKQAKPVPTSISEDGTVTWDGRRQRFGHLASPSSQAFDGQVLAVTLPTSFHVYLIGAAPAASLR